MTGLRSFLYFVWFIVLSIVVHIAFLPALLMPRRAAVLAARTWCAGVLRGLKVIAQLDYEIRGKIPPRGSLIASKHMSMWDTVALFYVLEDPVFVLKRELMRVPFYGWYAQRVGMIAIDRSAAGAALRAMTKAARDALSRRLSVIIFPEGTRKKAGATPDYKPGIAALYQRLDVPCIPVALNSGLFWTGPGGFLKKRGRIVLEFLPPLPPGLKRQDFMQALEARIEAATGELIREGHAILDGRSCASTGSA
jgi:1-acyl-sn-glycerol-3-phosphate acyltransferase